MSDRAETDDDLEDDDTLASGSDDDLDLEEDNSGSDDDVAGSDDSSEDDGPDDSDGSKAYTFTVNASGVVTGVVEIKDGVPEVKSIDGDETYTRLPDGSIVKTEPSDGGIETTTYTDANGDGVFERTSEVWTSADGMVVVIDDNGGTDGEDDGPEDTKGYSFVFSATGQLVSISEIEDGVSKPESIDSDETYVLNVDGTITKTELDDSGNEVTTYADPDGDGIFQRISEVRLAPDGTPLSSTLIYAGGAGDDNVAVRGGDDAVGREGADDFVIREGAELRIMDFDDSEGDRLVFDTGYGLTLAALQAAVTGLEQVGADLIVHFGPTVSITLVGVAGSTTLGWDDVDVVS